MPVSIAANRLAVGDQSANLLPGMSPSGRFISMLWKFV